MTQTRLIPLDEVRQILGGISRNTLYRRVQENAFAIRKIGRRSFVRNDELDAYINSLGVG